MAKKKTKLKIVNKFRFTVFCLVVISTLSCGVSAAMNRVLATNKPETMTVFVQAGDTLWDIARAHNPSGRDIREVVSEIKVYNGLKTATIQTGDALEVPYI